MEHRQLGSSGLRVSALTLGTMTFGGQGKFAARGRDRRGAGHPPGRPLPRPRRHDDRHRRRVLGRPVGGDRRRRHQGPPRPHRARHEGAHADGRRAERRRPLPPPPDRRVRGEPAPPRHRLHRPLPGARVGRADAARGDAARAGRARAVGQGALHRLLQLRGLADDQGARDLRARRLPAVRLPAGLLLAPGARRGVRDRAVGDRPGRGDPRLEPAGRRPAVGQVPPRRGRPGRLAAPDGLERAARPRRGTALRRRRRARRDRRGPRGLGRAGRARVAARPPGRDLADRRRAHRRATRRQPRRRRPASSPPTSAAGSTS